jgi:putative transcriptional regulator
VDVILTVRRASAFQGYRKVIMSHPNRSKRNPSPARNPSPEEVRQLRLSLGLTAGEAAKRVHASPGAWQQWEAGERPMHPVFWRTFRIEASKKVIGRLGAELIDPDDPFMYVVREVEGRASLGIVAGPFDDRWACFYASEVGAPRPPGLDGSYRHQSFEAALAAFEQLLADVD